MSSWSPARTLQQTDAILCAPGRIHEVETILLDGRPQRVYKNLWPSVRSFWISSVEKYSNKTCIVFENQRFTYDEVHQRAVKTAAVFRHVYGIHKDLLGAVPVLTNAFVHISQLYLREFLSSFCSRWLPLAPLRYCLAHTDCKIIIMDPERAERLAPVASDLMRDTAVMGFLVFDNHGDSRHWHGMDSFSTVLRRYRGGVEDILSIDPKISPEDNAAIMFTSGTRHLPYLCEFIFSNPGDAGRYNGLA
ncbi:hypothetical protein H0H81_007522 [Sphagnurus paluster]|uniref:AMP-dependent synthetase/ligase domain-containing protein n=1 Tax=Sphagnurus paluster TaxID=117069 RepID=A0A9P7GL29_9AGAR|nr:hypothetical protein H0H81_007522 [Sphagnurus paluster]